MEQFENLNEHIRGRTEGSASIHSIPILPEDATPPSVRQSDNMTALDREVQSPAVVDWGSAALTPVPANERARVIVLGSGFGAASFLRKIDDTLFDVVLVSPRNHFVFTPLLASSAVGTVELRSILRPARELLSGDGKYVQAFATSLDTEQKLLTCRTASDERMELPYDKIVIAIGSVTNTWNIPGVTENCLFLKESHNVLEIRNRILQRFEHASLNQLSPVERRSLLHFNVIGGGPTGVEFCGELSDLVSTEIRVRYPDLVDEVTISLIEASPGILGGFHESLRNYAVDTLGRQRVDVILGAPVVEVTATEIKLNDGRSLPSGLTIWSSGVKANELLREWKFPLSARGCLLVDDSLKVQGFDDVYALGDCATIESNPLPPTAQVATQEGEYLGLAFNSRECGKESSPFQFRNHGQLTYLGGGNAIADLPIARLKGFSGMLMWCSVYIHKLPSIRNKMSVLIDWFRTRVFGRDTSTL